MTFSPINTQSPFLVVNQTFSEDWGQFLVQMTKLNADIARSVNIREIGNYQLAEQLTGQYFFPSSNVQSNRQTFRTVVNFGALPNSTTKSVAHGIAVTLNTIFTRIYGCATNPSTEFAPIPYVNVGTPGDGVEINADGTNVNIKTTTANWTSFTAIVVLEYLKN